MAQFYFGRKTQNITAKVTESQKDIITEAAKKEGLSVSEFLMLALEFYFDRHDVESTHSPSEMPLEPMEVEEVADSKEDKENSINGEVGAIQPDRVYNYQESGSRMLGEEELYYLETDLEFYQEMVDLGNETNLYRAMKSYRSSLVEILSESEYEEAEEEIDALLAHYELEHLKN